jgi:hypothetical protein
MIAGWNVNHSLNADASWRPCGGLNEKDIQVTVFWSILTGAFSMVAMRLLKFFYSRKDFILCQE